MFEPEHANELISIDVDLPSIKRWEWWCIQFPDAAVGLARRYGTKKDLKYWRDKQKQKSLSLIGQEGLKPGRTLSDSRGQ